MNVLIEKNAHLPIVSFVSFRFSTQTKVLKLKSVRLSHHLRLLRVIGVLLRGSRARRLPRALRLDHTVDAHQLQALLLIVFNETSFKFSWASNTLKSFIYTDGNVS